MRLAREPIDRSKRRTTTTTTTRTVCVRSSVSFCYARLLLVCALGRVARESESETRRGRCARGRRRLGVGGDAQPARAHAVRVFSPVSAARSVWFAWAISSHWMHQIVESEICLLTVKTNTTHPQIYQTNEIPDFSWRGFFYWSSSHISSSYMARLHSFCKLEVPSYPVFRTEDETYTGRQN
mgnify:CR=1 FL=1